MAEVGLPGRRRQHGAGLRSRRRPVHRRAPGDRQDRVHRLDRDRPHGSCRRRAGNLKKVQLELGGKGANIVFDDANLDAAVQRLGVRHLPQPGAGVHRRLAADRCTKRIADEFLERFIALAASIKLGNPLDPDHRDGPADLATASRPRAALCRCRARAGRPSAHRRQGAGRPRARQRLLRRADDRRGRSLQRPGVRRKRCSARSSRC